MKEKQFLQVMAKLSQTTEFQQLATALKSPASAFWYLWVTASLESDFDHSAVSPRGAIGMFQLMPATIKLFKKAYPTLPILKADSDAAEHGRYACLHLVENINQARNQRPYFTFPQCKAGQGLIQSVRFYYVNGPKPTANPLYENEIINDQVRLRNILDSLFTRLYA